MPPWKMGLAKRARNDLAAIWIASHRRSDVNAAMDGIERSLTRDPRQEGEELSEGLWGINCPPLRALYEIDDALRQVKMMADMLTLEVDGKKYGEVAVKQLLS